MRKLIGMTDFVLEQKQTPTFDTDQGDWYYLEVDKLDKIRRYASFLKQPLTLGMFVPVDEKGSVIEEPDIDDNEYFNWTDYNYALERCLFEGNFIARKVKDYYVLSYDDDMFWLSWNELRIIESIVDYEFELTPTALKQLGL
jgi:hypothetical protein